MTDEKLQNIKDAHKKYADWWRTIDIDSCMSAMSIERFCELLLVEDSFWNSWANGFTKRDIVRFYQHMLFSEL